MPVKKKTPTKKTAKPKRSSGAKKASDAVEEVIHEFTETELPAPKPKKKTAKPKKAVAKKRTAKPRKKSSKAAVKQKEQEIDQQLTEIYENRDGSLPDMSAFERAKNHTLARTFLSIVVLVFFVSLVAWVYLTLFAAGPKFAQDDIVLSVQAEETVQVGDEVHYRVRFQNNQEVPIRNVRLEVRYPDGFVFERASVEPVTENNATWELDDIGQHQSTHIDIFGRLYGGQGQEQSLRAFLHYTPANFSSPFQKVANAGTAIEGAPVTVTLDGLDEVSAGAEGQFTLTVTPEQQDASSTPLENVVVALRAPEHFALSSASPEPSDTTDVRWQIDSLTETTEIVFSGIFSEEAALAEQAIGVDVLVSPKDGTDEYIFAQADHAVAVAKTDLAVNLLINGSAGDMSIKPGEKIFASVVVKNTGEAAISNPSVRVVFEAPSLDNVSIFAWNLLDDETDGNIYGEQITDTIRLGQITWNANHSSVLAQLDPEEEVVFDIVLPLKDAGATVLSDFEAFAGKAYAEVTFSTDEEDKLLSSAPITITFNSDTTLAVEEEIETNDDDNDVHTITWLLNNTFHTLEHVTLEAEIFGKVSVDEDDIIVPAGDVVYDKDEQKIVWTVDNMPTSVDVLAMQFAVVVEEDNPSQENLTSKVFLEALDTVTNETIRLVGDEILLNVEAE